MLLRYKQEAFLTCISFKFRWNDINKVKCLNNFWLTAEARARAIHHTQAENPLTLFVTDGTTKPLTGYLLYFIKPNAGKELKIRNIHEVLLKIEY